ncbi:MAG: heme peroxidase [Ilumatobacteraceae bacterium]|nr:heme peroxidase [Ilumatobacteraceae bacterium]
MKRTRISLCAALVAALAAPTIADASPTPSPGAQCPTPTTGYGRMFASASPASFSKSEIDALADAMMSEPEDNPTPEGQPDAEDNLTLTAGYTYFGQFIDHDLTLDDRSNDLTTPTPPSSLVNGRTPQLDLDSLYGSGPSTSPTLYQSDGVHLLEGALLSGSPDTGARDVPRNANGTAIVGDGRNDENRIVAGIHSLFIRFHNRTVDAVRRERPQLAGDAVFAEARRRVVQQYQQLVLFDYLPRIVDRQTFNDVLRVRGGRVVPQLRFYSACQQMPVEFSVAAYRFGHSQVRALYRINDTVNRLPIFSGQFGTPGTDLVGFSPSPSNFAIDWGYFFGRGPNDSKTQPGYKIDASLTNSLGLLPLPVSSAGPADLAQRNLLRSVQIGLPSGQDVARAIGVRPLTDGQILVGKATGDVADAKAITDVAPALAGRAPLWTYVLAEAVNGSYRVVDGRIIGTQRAPFRLGPVGSRIVAETFVGLLASDPTSILGANQRFERVPASTMRQFTDLVSGLR